MEGGELSYDPEWERLIDGIKGNDCAECNRNKVKRGSEWKVLIKRKGTANVRFVFVSQDPAVHYVKKIDEGGASLSNGEEVRKLFTATCLSPNHSSTDGKDIYSRTEGTPSERKVINFAKKLLDVKSMDIEGGECYWTHSLKCPPRFNNKEYKKDCKTAAKYCPVFLRQELEAIQSQKICVVALGGKSLRMCENVLGIDVRGKKTGIVNRHVDQMMAQWKYQRPHRFGDKDVLLLGFIHPASQWRYKKQLLPVERIERGYLRTIFNNSE